MALKALIFLLTITSLIMLSYSSRQYPAGPDYSGPALDCFSAVSEIRSCSGEIAAYFANGTIDISLPCCDAIALITHQCWPAVLGVFGLSPDQTDVLRGYCDATTSVEPAFGPVMSPVGEPLPAVDL